MPGPFPFLTAIGFCALGFLPAVVVHSVLRGERERCRAALAEARLVAAVAYARQRGRPRRCTLLAAWTGGAGAVGRAACGC